jgi:hypothetical protein
MSYNYANGPLAIPADTQYLVITQQGHTSQDVWYGPPDPQPSGSTTNYFPQIQYFKDEKGLLDWIEKNQNRKYGSPEAFKAYKVSPIDVKTTVSLTVTGT